MMKLLGIEKLVSEVRHLQARRVTVAFTNGCFDLLHAGHVDFLRRCKQEASRLVVGLNSDASVQLLNKAENRPINRFENRAVVLGAMECVDYIVGFEEATPEALIRMVRPDILIKGEDWAEKGVVGREFVESIGGRVVLLPLVEGLSTTNLIERIRGSKEHVPLMQEHISEHIRVVEAVIRQVDLLKNIADHLTACFDLGGRVYLLGNGGSAADAQHIAAELVGRFKRDRKALPAIALTTDTSILTAVSNDIGYEQVFSRQIEALVTKRDIVWALSVSGRSPNVICGIQAAKKIGATIIGFSGKSGGEMAELCDLCFCVDHERSDRVQEVHQLAYHLICDRIERRM